jgi:hypothetical protein
LRVLLFLLLYVLSSAISGAQPIAPHADYERILVPIAPTGPTYLRPGAHGSRWQSILMVRNAGDQPAEVFHPFEIFHCLIIILCEPGKAMPPHSTASTTDEQDWSSSMFATIGSAQPRQGAFMHVRRGQADEVFFDLLVREVTSAAENQGTRIPLVRESEMFTRPVELLNVTLTEAVRGRLRLYAMPAAAPPLVRVEMYSLGGEDLLGEVTLALEPGLRANFPRYAEAVLEPPRFTFESGQPVRLRITPLGEEFAYWAFVSLTNNETQLISIVTPE